MRTVACRAGLERWHLTGGTGASRFGPGSGPWRPAYASRQVPSRVPGRRALPPGDSRRSAVPAFRVEQTDPDRFYGALAADSVAPAVALVRDLRRADRAGRRRRPGVLRRRVRAVPGRRTPASTPTPASSPPAAASAGHAVLGTGMDAAVRRRQRRRRLLEQRPRARAATRGGWPTRWCGSPGRAGVVFLSYTPWCRPWGGHETSPWHYLGGRRAADRYARQHGHRPKNDVGRSLFAVPGRRDGLAGRTGEQRRAEVLDVFAALPPGWAQLGRSGCPGLREVVSWNS